MVLEYLTVWSQQFISQFTYLAVFVVSALNSSTLFIPLPLGYIAIFFAIGLGLHPLTVGILAGLGSATGEIISYLVGFGGTAVIEKYEKKTPKIVLKLTKFFKDVGFWFVLLFAFLPFPFDFIGVTSGVARYDIRKFYLAVIAGRVARTVLTAYGGYFVIPYILAWF